MSTRQGDKKNGPIRDYPNDSLILGLFVAIALLTFFLLPFFTSLGKVTLVFGFFPWYWFWGLTWITVWIIALLLNYWQARKK